MSTQTDVTKLTDHRPWPLPTSPWIMVQSWLDLLFAHWPIPVDAMQALIPPQLTLDTFEGNAWVGVVPFRMKDVRPRGMQSVPWLSAFPEFNIRTYVRSSDPVDPKPGVYFFSLDAGNPVAVSVARTFFLLPYFNAKMSLEHSMGKSSGVYQPEHIHYKSRRTHRNAPAAEFVGTYGPTGAIYRAQPNTLEHWLTERYCLYSIGRKGQVYRGDIHHAPWPLQPAYANISINTMAAASKIELPNAEPLLHFAKHLDVVVWPITNIG